ncbi:hypothetical protein SVAN01_10161 [Stagonosporopsis vannaccii]|nr:hypothetical protein SVAN01_10161 [Stagonosporopsis vannaccii]
MNVHTLSEAMGRPATLHPQCFSFHALELPARVVQDTFGGPIAPVESRTSSTILRDTQCSPQQLTAAAVGPVPSTCMSSAASENLSIRVNPSIQEHPRTYAVNPARTASRDSCRDVDAAVDLLSPSSPTLSHRSTCTLHSKWVTGEAGGPLLVTSW